MPTANRKFGIASSLAVIAQVAWLTAPFGLGPVQASAQQYCDTRRMTQAYTTEMVCVDSYLRSQKGNRYDIQSLTDAQDSTAWCEGEAGHGIGTTIKVTFEEAAPPLTLRAVFERRESRGIERSRYRGIRVS